MDQLIVLVMSRFGNIESHSVKCDFQILCNFDIKINRQMMPESKIVVYSVISEKSMLHGETVIKTDEIGANKVSFFICSVVLYLDQSWLTFFELRHTVLLYFVLAHQ